MKKNDAVLTLTTKEAISEKERLLLLKPNDAEMVKLAIQDYFHEQRLTSYVSIMNDLLMSYLKTHEHYEPFSNNEMTNTVLRTIELLTELHEFAMQEEPQVLN